MSATIQALGRTGSKAPAPRVPRPTVPRVDSGGAWLVDMDALAHCRALLSGHEPARPQSRATQPALLDVPPAYEQFCRSHFASVRRLHPELSWDDAYPAYAVALSAHAMLCDCLDAEREQLLARDWQHIRGHSRLDWRQASRLVADGCSALARLDPLAMRR